MSKKINLPYNRQYIDQSDIDAVASSLRGEYLTTGPEAGKFEKEIAEYVGAKYAVVCSSGTAALHLSMLALGISKGDCVLTSPITFIADANAARMTGADVAFVDIEDETANLDLNKVEAILRKKNHIKAIIPVHFSGHPVDVESLSRITSQYNVKIIEDGCHALGSSYTSLNNEVIRVGSCKHSEMTVFSFHPIKNITTGEGGAITTNDYVFYERLLSLRTHGTIKSEKNIKNKALAFSEVNGEQVLNPWYYEMQELGYNYKITDIQCALGLSQLKKINKFVRKRRKLAKKYDLSFSNLKNCKPVQKDMRSLSSNHLYILKINFQKLGKTRAELMNEFKKSGIMTQVHYIPVVTHPYFEQKKYKISNYPNSLDYYNCALSIPLFYDLTDKQQLYVISKVKQLIG